MGGKCSIIAKEHVSDEDFSYLGACLQASDVEELAVISGVKLVSFCSSLEMHA